MLLGSLSVIVLAGILSLAANTAGAARTNGLPWLMLLLDDNTNSGSPPQPPPDYPVYASTYETQVSNYKAKYGKNTAWADWMITNKARYSLVFDAARTKPSTLTVSFKYAPAPIAYNPPWDSEEQHMATFKIMAEGAYTGYNFNFAFNGDTSTSYANIIAGIPDNASYAWGKNVYLYYETIFNHEFGHVMKLLHHYDTLAEMGERKYMPPGDTLCIMDRSGSLYCSACRTALGIPLDVGDSTDSDTALLDILDRYPY